MLDLRQENLESQDNRNRQPLCGVQECEGAVKLKAPKLGWYVGQVNGKKWFSDGCFMAEGKRDTKRKPLDRKSMQRCYRNANRKLRAVRFKESRDEGPSPFNLKLAILSNGTAIQQQYYDYFHAQGADFFVGPRCGENRRDCFVVPKIGKRIVGVIMPVRVQW